MPIPLIPSPGTWKKRPMAATSCQGLVENNKVSLEPPLLQAKHPQLLKDLCSRPFPASLPFPGLTQHLSVCVVVRGPELSTGFEVQPHQCPVQGDSHWPHYCCSRPGWHWPSWPSGHIHWLIFSRLPTHTPRSFSTGQLSSHSVPRLSDVPKNGIEP